MECACPGTAQHKTVQYQLLFFVFLLLIQTAVETACPTSCVCNLQSIKTVTCRSGLSSFPSNVPTDVQIFSIIPLTGQAPNTIPTISAVDFANFKNSIRIQIQRSNIQSIAASTFSQLTNLKSLDLRNNKLKQISKSVFTGLTNLVLLDLSDNIGCAIDDDAFSALQALRTLRLSKIGLSELGDILIPLKSLEELDAHGNNLFRLRADSLQSLVNLKHLDVSSNDLYGIDEDVKPLISGVRSLHLDLNPWRCNCALNWIKSLPRLFVAPGQPGGGSVRCDVPVKFRYTDVIDIPDSEMKCVPAKVNSCTGPVVVKENDRVTITCDIEGDPFPDVTWVKPDGSNFNHEVLFSTQDTTTLAIPVTAYSDHNGQWTVIAKSHKTSDSKTIDVTVLTTTTTTSTTTTTTTTTTTLKPTTQVTKMRSSQSTTIASSQSTSALPLTTVAKITKLPPSKSNAAHTLRGSTSSSTNPTKTTTKGVKIPPTSNPVNPPPSPNGDVNSEKHYVVIIAAAGTGGIVCLIGMAIFAVIVYRTRAKRQVMDMRENSWSEDRNIVLSLYVNGTPPSTATQTIRR